MNEIGDVSNKQTNIIYTYSNVGRTRNMIKINFTVIKSEYLLSLFLEYNSRNDARFLVNTFKYCRTGKIRMQFRQRVVFF